MMTDAEFNRLTLAQHNALPNRERAERFAAMSPKQRRRLLSSVNTGKATTGESWDGTVRKFTPRIV